MESKKLKIKKALSLGIVTSIILITRSGSVQAFDKDHIKRIWGQDRYETSIKISQKGWEQGSEYVIIASGEGYADALSAAPLAKIKNASIILTKKNNLDDKVLEELKRLKVKHVLIIGGEGSVSKNVEDMIKKNVTSDVNRIGGENRYETSVKVAEQLGEVKNVFIVSGENYADALSVGSIAGIKGMPIILTERDNLSKEVSNYINDNNIAKAYIIGGTASIGEEVKKALPMSERINGLDRYETNKNVVERFISSFDLKNVYIALGDGQTGNEFADALSGSSLAAQKLAPIILADKSLQNSTQKLIEENILPTSSVNVLGGNFNIPDDIMKDINISAKFLDKAGEVYSNAIYGNAYISQDNITLKGDVKGNLYIEGNNVLVSNITVGGIVYINPSKDGKITLDSVKSDKIVVLSGSKNGIDLKNVKSKYLNLRSRNMASVNINDSTLIENTKISSPSTLEVNSGSFGNIEINDTFDSDKVEFKGVFDKPVTIKSEANLNMISGTTIYNVILDSHAIAKKIKFNGTGSFGNVYNKNNTVSLELGAKVSVCGVIEGLLKNSIISDNINNKMQQKNTNEFSSLYIPEKVRDGGSSGGSSSSSYLTVSSAIVSDINVANGTILNDIGLPSTVSINLSNNTKTTAAVTWDGGTPAYDGTKAGGYTFTGTIKVPEGVKNTNNVKAIMKVIVGAPVLSNEKSIISTNIGKLSKENITEVPAGTKVSALKAGLKVSDKASVEILTSAGSTVVEDQENVDVASEMVIKVTAEDGSSQDYSIIITPIMPEVPSTFTVNAPTSKDNKVNDDGKSRVLITWTDSTTITVDHYEIVAKVGSVPTVTDTVSGQTAIAKGTGAASFDWTAGENLHVAVVAVDANGLKTLCKGAISNVIVAPDTQTPIATTKNITSVGKLTDIEIENGTPKEALNLPALVPVTLDNGSTINTGVTWDTTSYKGSKAGTYKIEGTLTLPANVTNSKNLKAVQNVIVKAPVVTTKNIIFIQNLIDLTVLNGTTVEALNLPAKWPATLEDGSEIMVGITWYTSSYDGSKAGTYKIEGTLILPENITNSNKFKVVQNITVKAPGIKTRDIIVLPYFGDTTVLNGTAVEALNLPTEDLVSLEDGSDIMVGITWDTTNYDGSKAGTYKIEGTLILPANVTNTKNLKVVKNITVKAPGVKIRDIMVLSGFGDLLVLNGTAVEALNLPAEAPATLEDGSIIIVGITWDTTNYDGSKAGTYRLEGTLILPTNVTNSKNLKAMQNVIVKASGVTTKDIMVLPYFRDVTVLNGTAVKALNLPAEVLVPLEDGSIITIGVTWDTTSYDGSKAGTYRLEGTLTLPANVTNSKNLKAVQNVIVKAPGVTTKDIMFPPGFGDLLVLNGTAVEALNLPAEVLVSLEDGSRIMVGITWDTTSYDGGKAGTYKIEGTLTLPSNVTNSKNFKAVQNVIVKAPGVTTKDIMFPPGFGDLLVLNGTAVEALNLSAEAPATLEDGSIIIVGITWDTTSYDGSKAGTYRLGGTLTLPSNVTNSKNFKAVQNVIVKAPGVTTKDIMFPPGFGDLLVLNGTAVEALNLPAKVLVSLEDGSRIMVGITWDTTSYDGSKAGTYRLEGTLTLPSNVTNSKNFKAVQNVIVKAPGVTTKDIMFPPGFGDLLVLNGTAVEALNLSAEAPATLEDGSRIMVGITWDTTSYDGSKAGTYRLEGTLTLPSNVTNSKNFKAVQNVIVKAPGVTTKDIMFPPGFGDLLVLNGTAVEALNLPAEAPATLEDGSRIMVGITWDTTSYDGSKAGTYKIEGTLTLPSNVTNSKNFKAVQNIIVGNAEPTPENASLDNLPTAAPTISGTTTVGETLTAISGYADTDGDVESGTTYVFYRYDADGTSNETEVQIASTTATYVIKAADVGKVIKVKVVPKNAKGTGAQAVSVATAVITESV